MTLPEAQKMIESAENKARELNITISTAVVDEYGVLIAFSRMDGAIKISPKFALSKAYTAASLGMPTEKIAPFTGEGKPYFGIQNLFGGKLTTMAGGLPIIENGKLAGGIGVGGSPDVKQDLECAKAAIQA